MSQLAIFFGVMRYEYRMQIRRRSLWITYAIFALLLGAIVFGNDSSILYKALVHPETVPLSEAVVYLATVVNYLFPIVVGVMVADRLPRDRRTKVQELLTTTSGTLHSRILGKYLGSTLAALTPILIVYSLSIGYILYQTHNIMAIPLAIAAFASVVLPGLLFVSAFSLACPVILWVPLYQFLFVGYWFWGNLFPPNRGIPTLSNTLLSPVGGNAAMGLFGVQISAIDHATVLQGVSSIALLLGIAALVLGILLYILKWQQARQ
jgi:ABC-2 type transport system permease protein